MPVILGSSQTQVVSTQDGLAPMVPSAGSVGPCDVFIAVNAGRSTAQVQMESVAAIVPAQPNQRRVQAPTAQRRLEFGAQASPPQSIPEVLLFAVPEGASLEDPVASRSACSGARQDAASSTGSSSDASGTPGSGDVASRTCESSSELPPVEVEAPRPPAELPADSTERDNGGGAAPQPAETPSANHSLADHPSATPPSATPRSANSPSVGNPAVADCWKTREAAVGRRVVMKRSSERFSGRFSGLRPEVCRREAPQTRTGETPVPTLARLHTRYFFVHWSTQSLTVLYQSCEFCGFSTQWPSSGK